MARTEHPDPRAVLATHEPTLNPHTHPAHDARTHVVHGAGACTHSYTMYNACQSRAGGRWVSRRLNGNRHHGGVGNWEQREGSKGGATGVTYVFAYRGADAVPLTQAARKNAPRPRWRRERKLANSLAPHLGNRRA